MKLVTPEGAAFDLAARELKIGRAPGNDIVLNDSRISSEHAVIRPTGDGGYVIEDLDSTNGTLVNERRISAPERIKPGDTIQLGRVTLRVEGDPGFTEVDAPSAPPSAVATLLEEPMEGYKSAPPPVKIAPSVPSPSFTPAPSIPPPPVVPAEPAKKSNTLLIVGIIVGALALVCCLVVVGIAVFGGGLTFLGLGSLAGGSAQVTVINDSSSSICFLYISPTTSDTWGEDVLGSSVLEAGASRTFPVSAGSYDLRAETCDGGAVERFNERVDGTLEWTIEN